MLIDTQLVVNAPVQFLRTATRTHIAQAGDSRHELTTYVGIPEIQSRTA
ncbi:hypothetical protein [Agrococcus jejuensis]|nr:hypothetical protein [Agrococcus jejuensis]